MSNFIDIQNSSDKKSRRNFLLLAASQIVCSAASADQGALKNMRLIVSGPAGGSLDFGARIVAKALSDELKINVICMNKGGAAGTISASEVVRAAPDGQTLLYATSTATIVAPQTMVPRPFNSLKDLVPINSMGTSPVALVVNSKLGVKSLKDVIRLSKTRPVLLGSSGNGSLMHLAIESIARSTHADLLHVPYRGTGLALIDCMAGQIDGCVTPITSNLNDSSFVIAGVATKNRLADYPDVPALAEDIPGFEIPSWQGVFAPGNTPQSVIDTINAALVRVGSRDDVKSQFKAGAMDVAVVTPPNTFSDAISKEYSRWEKLLDEMGMLKT